RYPLSDYAISRVDSDGQRRHDLDAPNLGIDQDETVRLPIGFDEGSIVTDDKQATEVGATHRPIDV
ncbi:MAG: hypothetical protein ABSG39_07845, partial [Acidimicrobiales bacterium]